MNDMMAQQIDLTELRRLAKAATPGPWISPPRQNDYGPWVKIGKFVPSTRGDLSLWWHEVAVTRSYLRNSQAVYDKADPDAAYIAAANPATILRLLDLIEQLSDAPQD
jgi:hypothetical protein